MTRCEGGGCKQPAASVEFLEIRGQGMSVGVRRLCLWCWWALMRTVRAKAGGAS